MNNFSRFIIAFFIIAFGVILILENVGVETVTMRSGWSLLFPVLCIIFGLKWIIDGIVKRRGIWAWGILFLIFGVLLVLGHFEVIAFSYRDIFKLWPIIIIYAGLSILGYSFYKKPYVYKNDNGKSKKFYKKYNGFSIGDHEFNEANWKVEPMKLGNLAGDFYLDFTKAFIPEEEIPIVIDAIAGDVHILMPQNVPFRVNAAISAGEINVVGQKVSGVGRTLQYESVDYEEAIRKIDFELHLKAGEIRVDRV